MQSVFTIIAGFLGLVVLAVVFSAILALPVMWLWNACIPDIFNLREIGFIDAWQLMLLCSFLFKSSSSNSK